jgi:hypothetical protein
MNSLKKQNKFSYKLKAFRLDDKTIKALGSLKSKVGKTYNLLFLDMIYSFQKHGEDKRT